MVAGEGTGEKNKAHVEDGEAKMQKMGGSAGEQKKQAMNLHGVDWVSEAKLASQQGVQVKMEPKDDAKSWLTPLFIMLGHHAQALATAGKKAQGPANALKMSVDKLINKFPGHLQTGAAGVLFCLCGGLYPALAIVILSLGLPSWVEARRALRTMHAEINLIVRHRGNEDDEDEKKGGEEVTIEGEESKLECVLRTLDPKRVDRSMAGIFMTWVCLAASLHLPVARTVHLALASASMLNRPVQAVVGPSLRQATPAVYARWVPVLLDWACVCAALGLAWFGSREQAAIAAALRGGRMVSSAVVKHAQKHGGMPVQLAKLKDLERAQHGLAWGLALLGLYLQSHLAFRPPLVVNLLLLPLSGANFLLRMLAGPCIAD